MMNLLTCEQMNSMVQEPTEGGEDTKEGGIISPGEDIY